MDAETRKAIRMFIYHFIILAGALSCVLVWLKIEPKDLWGWHVSVSLPHWFWLALAIGLFVVGLVSSGYSLRRSLRTIRQPSKLEIHSAFYGTGPESDRDVTAVLQNHAKDALAFDVENNSFGIDPAPMRQKRLEVEYSYGNRSVKKVSRPEGTRLIIPEDLYASLEIQRLVSKVEELTGQITAAKAIARTTELQLPLQRPRIVPVRYGKHSDGHYGLFIENSGEPAFDVSVSAPVAIGEAKLIFHIDFPNLTKADGTVLLKAYIEKRPHVIDLGDLFEAMRSRGIAAIDFPIRYKDGDNQFYVTNCKIERDVTKQGGLAVRFVGQELADSPTNATIPSPTDPRIRLEVTSAPTDKAPWRETRFLFHNEGGGTAYRAQMREIDLSSAKPGKAVASFRVQETIPANDSKSVAAIVDTPLTLFVNDIVPFLNWELEASSCSEISKSIVVGYDDYAGARLETLAELVYMPPAAQTQAEMSAAYADEMRRYHRKNPLEVASREEIRQSKDRLTIRNQRFQKVCAQRSQNT